MKYKKNIFSINNIAVSKLANKFGTPLYCYSFEKIRENIRNLKKNFKSISPLMCFAVKSNPNLRIIHEIGKMGLGADVVSKGELLKALKAKIKPNKIVFSGVGKTKSELNFAIQKKILLINAESESEILDIEKIAKLKKIKVNIGIRLNPNTDAKTLSQISTGKKENKFGVDKMEFLKLAEYCKNSKNLELKCLSAHIGSQILNYKPYEKMLKVIDSILKKLNHKFEYIDLGGGMGIRYNQKDKMLDYKRYNYFIKKFKNKNKNKIIFEPGRSIIGNAGVLLSKVIHLKENKFKTFIIIDAGMNDLMRPALYNAKHEIIPAKKNKIKQNKLYEFVGPICESTDKFLTIKKFQKIKKNDLIVIRDTGAYGYSLSSNYNIRPKPAEILVKGSNYSIIQKRQKIEDLI
tara:strand:+ start:2277 stop:3491 length:1215 start_codon:yes stop_codon:yes gene_type:complete